MIFVSKGYFKSKNCRREIYAAVKGEKPVIIVYEGQKEVIKDMKSECKRYCIDNDDFGENQIARYIFANDPILWLGTETSCMYIESVKVVTLHMLYHFYHYKRNPSLLDQGLEVKSELGPVKNSKPISGFEL